MSEKDTVVLARATNVPGSIIETADDVLTQLKVSRAGILYATLISPDGNPGGPGGADTSVMGGAQAVSGSAPIGLDTIALAYAFDVSGNVINAVGDAAPEIASNGFGLPGGSALMVASFPLSRNFTNGLFYNASNVLLNGTEAVDPAQYGVTVAGIPYLFNGATGSIIAHSASAANLALQSGLGNQLVRQGGNWSIHSEPAVNVQATISRAAVAAQRHICNAITASINAVAAIAAPISLYLRDGASGAGTILKSWRVIVPIGQTVTIEISGLSAVGSINTAMTLEWGAAPGAGNFENVSLEGYTAA